FIIMSRIDEKLDFAQLPQLIKDRSRSGQAEFRVASPGFFKTLHIPLVSGRFFDDRDAPNAPPAALINASLARKQWPNESPLGKIIQFGNMDGDLRPFTIVGVVGDIREGSLADAAQPTFYAYYRQRPRRAGRRSASVSRSARAARMCCGWCSVRERGSPSSGSPSAPSRRSHLRDWFPDSSTA